MSDKEPFVLPDSTLARMAGNIAAGLVIAPIPPELITKGQWADSMARMAVIIARAIVAEINRTRG